MNWFTRKPAVPARTLEVVIDCVDIQHAGEMTEADHAALTKAWRNGVRRTVCPMTIDGRRALVTVKLARARSIIAVYKEDAPHE